MQLSLLIYICTTSLVYCVGPSRDYEATSVEFVTEYFNKRSRQRLKRGTGGGSGGKRVGGGGGR